MAEVTLSKSSILIDGKKFFYVGGDLHYFRVYPGGSKRRLELMKAFGLTAVQTYVPWNLHEPEKGRFCFDGLCDLEGFLKLCADTGLKVMLRPSPYICSEWDCGGVPAWVLRDGCVPRTSDPAYLKHVEDYYKVLCKKFLPYLATNGGPVIAVAVENEYGSYGNDKEYLAALAKMLTDNGVDVPLYTTDGHMVNDLANGTVPGVWAGVNYRIESAEAIADLRAIQKDKPALIGEYWCGRAIHWGEPFAKRDADEVAAGFREALEGGGLLTFYMFTGGTNFGFMNGANFGKSFSAPPETPKRYIPHVTSYDEDALLDEQGKPTAKYFACRKQLWEFLDKPEPPMPETTVRTQVIEPIALEEYASLWDVIDRSKAKHSQIPLTFEQLGQDYGYALYSAELVGTGMDMTLSFPQNSGRADVYVDGALKGTVMRDRNDKIEIKTKAGKTYRVDVLFENTGRINYGPYLFESTGPGRVSATTGRHSFQLFGWDCLSLPFRSLGFAAGGPTPVKAPAVMRGRFRAEPGCDTFLDMRNFGKGFVFINGFNLGRYWKAGPQYTLYVPGELLKEDNVVEVFDQYAAAVRKTLKTRKSAIIK